MLSPGVGRVVFPQQPGGFDVNRMAHREHAPHARLDQARRDGAEDRGLAHRGATARFEDDKRDGMARQKIAETTMATGDRPVEWP